MLHLHKKVVLLSFCNFENLYVEHVFETCIEMFIIPACSLANHKAFYKDLV